MEVNHFYPENKSSELLEETLEIKFKMFWTQPRHFHM
jgi:predicted CoA-binding protein